MGEAAVGQWLAYVEVGRRAQETVIEEFWKSHRAGRQHNSTEGRCLGLLQPVAQSAPTGSVAIGDEQPGHGLAIAIDFLTRELLHLDIGVRQVRLNPVGCRWVGVYDMNQSIAWGAHDSLFGQSRIPPLLPPFGVISSRASLAQIESGVVLSTCNKRLRALSNSPLSMAMRA